MNAIENREKNRDTFRIAVCCNNMLKLRKVRELNLVGTLPSRPNYVYSASGLVKLGQEFVVIADDELHVAIFPDHPTKTGRWMQLFPGELSDVYKKRKKEKPDLEAITVLPPYDLSPGGALLVVPSMSRPNRIRGALIASNANELHEPIPIDFSEIHKELSSKIQELNIEGVIASDQMVRLFHRGSQGNGKSAIIDFEASQFLRDLHDTRAPKAKSLQSIREYDLGKLNGVDLAFTDACKLSDGRIVFLASAESSKNAYDDGLSAGSAIGILNKEAEVVRIECIDGLLKLEGISAKESAGQLDLRFVSDSDDEHVPAALFAATWTI